MSGHFSQKWGRQMDKHYPNKHKLVKRISLTCWADTRMNKNTHIHMMMVTIKVNVKNIDSLSLTTINQSTNVPKLTVLPHRAHSTMMVGQSVC